jgi:hypothetical protein
MSGQDLVILVISRSDVEAENLKELIEFMDTPHVRMARPGHWREALGDDRLEALFIGPDVTADEADQLVGDIGDLDPNVPIVMTTMGDAS